MFKYNVQICRIRQRFSHTFENFVMFVYFYSQSVINLIRYWDVSFILAVRYQIVQGSHKNTPTSAEYQSNGEKKFRYKYFAHQHTQVEHLLPLKMFFQVEDETLGLRNSARLPSLT